MRAAACQVPSHVIRRPRYERVRAIAVMEQIVLTDGLHHVCVFGHHPEWVKVLGFDQTERQVRAQPSKAGKKRFLPRIGFWRGD